MFFNKKKTIEKATVEISGEISRISVYTSWNDSPILIFSIKNNTTLFYQKNINPKNSLSKVGDSITVRIEEGTKSNNYYGSEMLEVYYFTNHSLLNELT